MRRTLKRQLIQKYIQKMQLEYEDDTDKIIENQDNSQSGFFKKTNRMKKSLKQAKREYKKSKKQRRESIAIALEMQQMDEEVATNDAFSKTVRAAYFGTNKIR